jgi:hypothetical protein
MHAIGLAKTLSCRVEELKGLEEVEELEMPGVEL